MEDIILNHVIPIQLRFNDIDQFGHVNNSVYFSFYDLGKTSYFSSVCPHVDWSKDAIMVVHLEVDFKEQIFSTDKIVVKTAITEIGEKSFKLYQQVVDENTNRIKCDCISIMVTYNLIMHQTCPVPEDWVEAICKFEGRDVRRNNYK